MHSSQNIGIIINLILASDLNNIIIKYSILWKTFVAVGGRGGRGGEEEANIFGETP